MRNSLFKNACENVTNFSNLHKQKSLQPPSARTRSTRHPRQQRMQLKARMSPIPPVQARNTTYRLHVLLRQTRRGGRGRRRGLLLGIGPHRKFARKNNVLPSLMRRLVSEDAPAKTVSTAELTLISNWASHLFLYSGPRPFNCRLIASQNRRSISVCVYTPNIRITVWGVSSASPWQNNNVRRP